MGADHAGQDVPATSIWTGASPVPTIAEGSPTIRPKMISAERFLSAGSAQGTAPTAEVKDWTWAIDLSTGEVCLVPAPLVYPVLRGLSPLGDAGVGISSAKSWAEAIGLALLKICRYLTITQLEHIQYPHVDLSTVTLSPEGTRLRHLLEQMGERVTAYDVTGPLQVPTFAICSGDKTLAYGTHVDIARALQSGFEQALLCKQLSGEQALVNSLPSVPDLPQERRSEVTEETGARTGASPVPTIPYDASQEWPDLNLWLQDVLQMNGWRAFAVPLDHDPVLRQIYPCIVHVVVARD
jgi:YcaO cyclodehydratase, ATP-ad Mg2+-binding